MGNKLKPNKPHHWNGERTTLDHLIAKAQAGDTKAAKALMREFVAAVKQGECPDHEVMHYFAFAFHRMLDDDVRPEKALHVAKPRGAPRGPQSLQDLIQRRSVAIQVWGNMKLNPKATQGESLEIAVESVAEQTGLSESTVKRAYLDDRKWIQKNKPFITVHFK